jgi:hypothetical protein
MIAIEQQIETGLRAAIRASLQTASAETEQLAKTKIVAFWLAPENDGDNNDASGLHVFIKANPNGSGGYNPNTGFEAQRTVQVDIGCVTPMDDSGKTDTAVYLALYKAVRSVFEAAPFTVDLGTGIVFGGMLINNGGTAELEDVGQVASFTVEMHISVTA